MIELYRGLKSHKEIFINTLALWDRSASQLLDPHHNVRRQVVFMGQASEQLNCFVPKKSITELDLIIQKAKTGLVDRDYWPAVHMKALAEDFELTSQELGRLVASLKKGKTYSRTNPMTIRTQLTESVGDLMDTHKRLKQYINHHLGKWAAKNHLPSPTIFEDHVRPQEK
jgi:hypothetical protein